MTDDIDDLVDWQLTHRPKPKGPDYSIQTRTCRCGHTWTGRTSICPECGRVNI